jgi:ribosomal protein S6E (S10)
VPLTLRLRKGEVLKTLFIFPFYKMAFKINVSHKGKTFKLESEDEFLIGKKIGESFKGVELSPDLQGYELLISGTSDLAGIPGFKEIEGIGYTRRLLTYGKGMKDRRSGMRLRKTNRGNEISSKTVQINMKVLKEGEKKFSDLIVKKEEKTE